jgi:phage baseplate assembly protein gpV
MARNRDEREDDEDEDDRPRRRRPRDEDDEEEERPRSRRRSRDDDDEDDRPARSRRREEPKSSGGKTVLIVFSILGGLLLLCGGGAAIFYFTTIKPTADNIKESFDNAANNAEQGNKAKRLGLSLHNYDTAMGKFPHPYAIDLVNPRPNKAPTNLSSQLSWRVTLLPYIDQEQIMKKFDFNSAWDSTQNKPMSTVAVFGYSDFDTPSDPTTRWKVFYDNGAMFDTNPNARTTMVNVTDGLSNTIMIVEAADKVPWSQFNEIKFEPNGPIPNLGRSGGPVPKFTVVMGDCSVRTARQSADPRIIKAAITKAGGEVEAFNLFD